MTLIKTLAAAAAGTVLATSAFAQSAREIRGASPYVAIENEPAPKLIVDPPLPEGLAIGVFWAQYRVENVRIVPVFGAGALQASPRIGHLHIIVDDLPWWWADASDNNTVDIAGLPPGEHKVKIALVDANHNVFPGQVVTHDVHRARLGETDPRASRQLEVMRSTAHCFCGARLPSSSAPSPLPNLAYPSGIATDLLCLSTGRLKARTPQLGVV